MFQLYKRFIPNDMEIDHLCRNPGCCNPDHLELVTHAENNRRRANVKLSKDDVLAIRRRWKSGETQASLAREYGVHSSHISRLINGVKWKGIEPLDGD